MARVMKATNWLGCLIASSAVALSACGGASGANSAPAQTAAAPSPSAGPAATDTGPGGPPVSDGPGSPELMAGIKAFDAGSYADARKSFEAATKKNPNDTQAFYNLGLACEKLGDKATAEAAYKSALALRPDFDTAAAALSTLEIDAGRTDEALAVARNGLAKHPGSAPLHDNLGIALAMRGDRDDATAEFQQAIKITPADPMLHLTFAHWLNTWKVRGAGPHLDAALAAAKDDVGMLAAIGFEYRMSGDFDSCVKTFDRAVQIKDGGEVRTERALCKMGQKDEKWALDDLQAAVAKESGYAPGHYYLGGRLATLKRFQEAATEYAKYIELAPTGSLAKQASDRMKAAQDRAAHDKGAVAAPKKK
jgi:tetratricopeptide (TPR) repeat protein